MVRGTLVLILDGKFYWSGEFNGGMDIRHPEIMEGLKHVRTLADFENFIKDFNNKHYHYPEKLIFGPIKDKYLGISGDMYSFEEMHDMSEKYFDKWFSDYLYILCLDDYDEFTTSSGETASLSKFGVGVFEFGNRSVMRNDLKIDFMSSVENLLSHTNWFLSDFFNEGSTCVFYLYPEDIVVEEDFCVEIEAGSLNEFVDEVCKYAHYFDPDEHVEMWIKARGHVHGIPSIRDLLDEADKEKESLVNFAEDLRRCFRG